MWNSFTLDFCSSICLPMTLKYLSIRILMDCVINNQMWPVWPELVPPPQSRRQWSHWWNSNQIHQQPAIEFSRNTKSWQRWHFCTTSNGLTGGIQIRYTNNLLSSFPVIQKVGNVGIFVQLLMGINWKQLGTKLFSMQIYGTLNWNKSSWLFFVTLF